MDGFTAGFIAGATIGGFFAGLFVYAYFHDKREEDRGLIAWLVSDLDELANAENAYRACHDQVGPSHMRTGRAWDRMRRAGDEARKTIWSYRNARNIVVTARKAAA